MKKGLVWMLALFLAVAAAGCGNQGLRGAGAEGGEDGTGQKDIAITLWTYPVGNWGESAAVANLLSRFHEAYPNIHVSVNYLQYSDGDSIIDDAIAKGQLPDLVFEGPERLVAHWGEEGRMVDLSDLWAEDAAGQVYSFVRDACQHRNGEFYEFPICMGAHCMAINYQMFQEAGALQYIDEESHTWTTEGFIQAVHALVEHGQKQVGAIYCKGQGGDQGTRALVNNLYGGSFTDGAHTEYTIDSEENIKALQLLYDLEGIRFDPEIDGGGEIAQFIQGELAMAFCWNGSLEVSQTMANPDRDFDVFPMAFPTSDGEPRLQGGIWGFGIFDNGDGERIEAAKEFIRFMAMEEEPYKRAVLASAYWPVRDMEDLYVNDILMTEYGLFNQYMGDYYQVTPKWTEARAAWWKMLQKIGKGLAPSKAVKGFCKAVD
jgi:multiple sugar transport system substrate-binding protein